MPNEHARDVAILIPSYQPDGKLPPYVQTLRDAGFAKIVVVDDGSGEAYTGLFNSLQTPEDATVHVIRYEPNHGKGYALRVGMQWIWDECPACAFVITADSDGQHTAPDTLRMAEALHENGVGLLLGSRDFSQADVPPKSRMGNHITTAVYHALYGQRIGDTQTGLRGFARDLLPRFLKTRGDRYEYEMNQLIDCSIDKIPIRALPIQTVYENNNAGSHFHPVRDSWRIYRVILVRFFRFIAASLICFCVDYALYLLFNHLFKEYVPSLNSNLVFLSLRIVERIGLAALLARLFSSVLNYFINKSFVFSSSTGFGKTFWRYACTVVLIVAISAWLTSSLHLWFGWNDNLVKMPVDILLFFLSYYLQRRWVFGGEGAREISRAGRKDG
ncbi:MAG TPA: bifunctional glycosyltransferase family 2/GtrA family protein [Candidatus Limiplasma sp.]|nr:bifunctional glycosyltransferase family 2/GtrA family protein [Candidatus Limiplasma sp.]